MSEYELYQRCMRLLIDQLADDDTRALVVTGFKARARDLPPAAADALLFQVADLRVEKLSQKAFAVEWFEGLTRFGAAAPGVHSLSLFLREIGANGVGVDVESEIKSLSKALNARCAARAPGASAGENGQAREREVAYLRHLLATEFAETDAYTPLAADAHLHVVRPPRLSVRSVVIEPRFAHSPRMERHRAAPTEPLPIETDIVPELRKLQRVALLGEPGAGKTATLWRLAGLMIKEALEDDTKPLPLRVRLGYWREAAESWEAFLEREVGAIGSAVGTLFSASPPRAFLLLDGLNEIPVAQRSDKARMILAFLGGVAANVPAILTCRADDFRLAPELELGTQFDQVTIRPLDPLRIHDFLCQVLQPGGAEQASPSSKTDDPEPPGATMFWALGGGRPLRDAWAEWRDRAHAPFELFCNAPHIPGEPDTAPVDGPNVYTVSSGDADRAWRQAFANPRSLMRLASNPFMLQRLVWIYGDRDGELPANRGALFADLVDVLLNRERQRSAEAAALIERRGTELLDGLGALAFHMQAQGVGEDGDAATVVVRSDAELHLDPLLVKVAADASLLTVDADDVRFTHQLLQEYFASTVLRRDLRTGFVTPQRFWPRQRWWERTNWEETLILLAGQSESDLALVLDWLGDAQPEVTAAVVARSGLALADEDMAARRKRWHDDWLPRLTDERTDPSPHARAAIGRALAALGFDDRPGVGTRPHPRDGRAVPDIEWLEVPDDGPFTFQEDPTLTIAGFKMARYPITNAQFQSFLDDPNGYDEARWWVGLSKPDGHRSGWWTAGNLPRETVDWFEATAFCRWLTALELWKGVVRLPTEIEWEKAARGTDGREFPWGPWESGRCNVYETWSHDPAGELNLAGTSPVGMFPRGVSPYGIADMSGNVWEWTATPWRPDWREADGASVQAGADADADVARVVRGGSWLDYRYNARAAYRSSYVPADRDHALGFRVVLGASSPIS